MIMPLSSSTGMNTPGGTRPRSGDPVEDAKRAADLLADEKVAQPPCSLATPVRGHHLRQMDDALTDV
jgi:hypothetical protein